MKKAGCGCPPGLGIWLEVPGIKMDKVMFYARLTDRENTNIRVCDWQTLVFYCEFLMR